MNARMSFGIAVICMTAAGWTGNVHAQVRFSPTPVAPDQERVITPRTQFDKTAALRALEKGTSTIAGTACWRVPYAGSRAGNAMILLLPVTPHLEELISLRKKAKPGETVLQSKDVLETSIATMADGEGRFQFTELKAGRYYLYGAFNFTHQETENVYRGTAQGANVTVNFYSPETTNYNAGGEIEKIVEVKKDGEVVRTSLTNKGVYATLFKCALT